MTNVTRLRDAYDPMTRQEAEWCNDILAEHPGDIRGSVMVADLRARGLTPERAKALVAVAFHPGGPPATRLGMVIAQHSNLSTPRLCEAVQRHAPEVSVAEIIAELRRQSAANMAAADALDRRRATNG